MLTDSYETKINDGFGVETTSPINKNVSIIESCGVKIKDIIEYAGEVCYIPTNERDLKSRRMFLMGHGFIVEDNHIIKKK